MEYRKDIQVLRGVSVLLVVLFHLEIGGLQSGFLGVDVFFVISGFLMGVLYDGKNISSFFSRRAKRLLPAYFMTVIITLIASAFIINPIDFKAVAEQALFSLGFSSNIGFWLENSYFSKAEFKPLLHLWSLGLEIQFYLIVPLLFIFLRKITVPLIILIFSLLSCFIMLTISPKTSFFMLPFRLWEFLIGLFVAYYYTNNGAVKYGNNKSWLGAIAIVIIFAIPFMNVNGNELSVIFGHPGFFAFLVTSATATVLLFGLPKLISHSFIANMLEILGKYSYSIYLVHFPIIVLFLYEPFEGTNLYSNDLFSTLKIITLIAIASFLMYHIIELQKVIKSNSTNLLITICSIIVLIFAGNFYQSLQYTQKERSIFSAWEDRDVYRCGKLERILHPTSISCNLTSIDATDGLFLVGNSHADSIKSSFAEVATAKKLPLWFMVNNRPLMHGGPSPKVVLNESILRKVKLIVLHYSPGSLTTKNLEELVRLSANEGIKVKFIMPVPVWEVNIPRALLDNLHFNTDLPQQSLAEYYKKHDELIATLRRIKSEYANFSTLEIAPLFCRNKCRVISENNQPYYFDDSHLTLTGAKLLKNKLTSIVIE